MANKFADISANRLTFTRSHCVAYFRLWRHETDMPMQSPHVRCRGNNGSRISVLRLVFRRRRLARARGKLEHRRCRALTTQLPKRAFIAKHLNIGSGAAGPATPDTTSSGKALNGDFTNTAHQRSTRPTIAFAQSCGKLQWVLSPRPMRTETLL